MTEEDQDKLIGQSLRQYSDHNKAIACLRMRLGNLSSAIDTLLENPMNEEARKTITSASDPREDAKELLDRIQNHGKLKNFFRQQGLELPD